MLHSSILELKEENTRLKDQIAQMHTYPATPAAKAATPAALKAGTTVVTRASAAKAVPKKADSSSSDSSSSDSGSSDSDSSSSSSEAPTPAASASGFVKPSVISDELIEFLGKEKDTMMSRVEVSKEINAYITANQLKDKVSGRQINPDAKLAALLKLKKTDELTYFNLQRYMSPHFAKTVPAVAPVVASA